MTPYSPAELRVIELIMKGFSNKEAGELLGIQETTVKFHLTSIYKKAGVHSKAQLIVKLIGAQKMTELFTLPKGKE